MTVTRSTKFLMYMFQHHILINEQEEEVACLFAPTDPNGLFASHEDWQELVDEVRLFYDSITPSELGSVNEHILSRQESRQRQRTAKRPPPRRAPGYVYLLKGGGYYKIGLSKCVYRRWREISPKLPFEVEIVCRIATEDMHGLETSLHERFASKRANGEWFELDEADVEYIRGLANE